MRIVIFLLFLACMVDVQAADVVLLGEKEINEAAKTSKNGYIIDKAGSYALAHNINWANVTADSFAITIAADNVQLNGQAFMLKQNDTSIEHAIAIQLRPCVKNVTIENITLKDISGGGIWCRGGNESILIKRLKAIHCGYLGKTLLDKKSLPQHIPHKGSQVFLFDGGRKMPIKHVQVRECTFVESGILRSEKPQYETACSAIGAYQADGLQITGCAIDGCVGRDFAAGVWLASTSNVQMSDVIITDIISSGKAEGVCVHDIDGELNGLIPSSIFSNISPSHYSMLLDTHGAIKKVTLQDDKLAPKEFSHLKAVVPKHKENMDLLFREHTWKEFRTLGRLVCHNADHISKTTAIYGKWVELFCKKVLGINVAVEVAFANLYTTGDVPLPAHRDDCEKWIFGLSFGETRTFDFIPDNKQTEVLSFEIGSGDVFLFSPLVNKTHEHRMLAQPERRGKRINLTYFLEVKPGEDCSKFLRSSEIKAETIPTFEEATLLYNQSLETSKKEEKKVIYQDELGNFYEKVNGKLVPLNK